MKMNYWDPQQNNTFVGANKGMRGSPVYIPDRKDPVVFPKPRRVGLVLNNPVRPLRCHISQAEVFDSKAGAELLDIILKKEGFGSEQSATQLASSPPFFTGSPPSRVANPLIQDARFGDDKLSPFSVLSATSPSSASSSSSSTCKGGSARMKVGLKPAAVRVEGFECLNRDRRGSRISAVA